jgi:signal transduction histidine kinase
MPEDDARRIYAEHARDGLIQMANMVRDILNFGRKSRPTFSPIDIPQSIRHILSSFSDQISAQNIEVEVKFDEDIPVVFSIDVEQIFINIIKNAIQAMTDGGTLHIDAKMPSPELFEATFSDTGPGIPDEIRDMIFDPFFTTKAFGQGVGLGLSISDEIAKSYNGSIEVKSRTGEGTTFIVTLPMDNDKVMIMEGASEGILARHG